MRINRKCSLYLTLLAMAAGATGCGSGDEPASMTLDNSGANGVEFLSLVFKKLKFAAGAPGQPKSSLCYAVFAGPQGFPNNQSAVVKNGCKEVDSTVVSMLIEDLPPSADGYAISVFQDLNGNGKLDTRSLLGLQVPDEPFGFSNNPTALRAPTYDEVRVAPRRSGDKVEISMRSL